MRELENIGLLRVLETGVQDAFLSVGFERVDHGDKGVVYRHSYFMFPSQGGQRPIDKIDFRAPPVMQIGEHGGLMIKRRRHLKSSQILQIGLGGRPEYRLPFRFQSRQPLAEEPLDDSPRMPA